jgi:hypothetical protein
MYKYPVLVRYQPYIEKRKKNKTHYCFDKRKNVGINVVVWALTLSWLTYQYG